LSNRSLAINIQTIVQTFETIFKTMSILICVFKSRNSSNYMQSNYIKLYLNATKNKFLKTQTILTML